MNKYRNLILFSVLIGLSAITFWLFTKKDVENRIAFKDVDFSVSEASNPDSILLSNNDQLNVLKENNGEFILNNTIKIKPELQEALTLILKRLKVKRPVSKKLHKSLLHAFDTAGVKVEVYENDILLKSFFLWGDKEESVTYAKLPDQEEVFIVNIAGYSTYIADIFFLSEEEWRSNALFESTWRSLKGLNVAFPASDTNSFSIQNDGNFLVVPELEAFDTLALLNYLDEFSQVRITEYLTTDNDHIDSLLKTEPDLIVKINDFESAKSNQLYFYEDDKNNAVIVLDKNRQLGLISTKSFLNISKTRNHFLQKEKE